MTIINERDAAASLSVCYYVLDVLNDSQRTVD